MYLIEYEFVAMALSRVINTYVIKFDGFASLKVKKCSLLSKARKRDLSINKYFKAHEMILNDKDIIYWVEDEFNIQALVCYFVGGTDDITGFMLLLPRLLER